MIIGMLEHMNLGKNEVAEWSKSEGRWKRIRILYED